MFQQGFNYGISNRELKHKDVDVLITDIHIALAHLKQRIETRL